jgi:electron transport complex protein RnfG
MESSLKNMVVSLLIITLASSAAVGLVYRVTEGPIAGAKVAKVNTAIAGVLPAFDNDPAEFMVADTVDGREIKAYTAMKGDSTVGYAVETFTMQGFGGEIRLMVGFLPDGTICRVETLSQHETPGLGDKIEHKKSDFAVQFEGKNPAAFKMSVRKDGGDIDAITASTITSRAFADALNRAYKMFQSVQNKGGGQNE